MSSSGYQSAEVERWQLNDEQLQHEIAVDHLAQEVPVALVFNGIAHAVMLCTPLDLEDFARGFALSEKIVEHNGQIYEIELAPHTSSQGARGIEVRLEIASQAFQALKQKRRNLAGRTGCGLCGVESLAALDIDLPPVVDQHSVNLATVWQAQRDLRAQQVLNRATGSLHAAAWVSLAGEIVLVREDVGRHNALDKLIGALALQARTPGFCLLTSRASYELVQKAARAQMAILATVSAPTSLAVQMAQQAGLTLLGFVREQRAVVYAHGQRILT